MAKEQKEGDSLYWVVEQECARLQGIVAISHAKRGNYVVLMTPRKIAQSGMDELADAGVEVVSTKGQR